MVTQQTINHYTTTSTVYNRVGGLFPEAFQLDDVTTTLIRYLDQRGLYWMNPGSGFGEGINGWLDPEETKLLVMDLPTLPTMSSEPDPTSDFWQIMFEEHGGIDGLYERHVEHLHKFQLVAQLAVQMEYGLLWGRDLHLFYDFYNVFDEHESSPTKV